MEKIIIRVNETFCDNIPVWGLGSRFEMNGTETLNDLKSNIDNVENGKLFMFNKTIFIIEKINLWKHEIEKYLVDRTIYTFDYDDQQANDCVNFEFHYFSYLRNKAEFHNLKCIGDIK